MNTSAGPPAAAGTEFDLLGALFSPAGRADPHVILRSSPLPGCQYPFVRDVLRDPRFAAPSIPPSADPAFQLLARWMIRLDGDRHRRVRDAFGGLFTARRAGRYRAIIAERAAALIDHAAPAGSMDLVVGFARPLPFSVINDVLGVPSGDRDWLDAALAVLNRGFARQRDSDRTAVQAANDAAQQMLSYFAGLLDQRTAEPADDLMTALAARHAEGEDRQDLLANCIFFINAGHQTTTTLLTLGTHLLCTHPEALAALQEDPGRWPGAVEEMLRLITPTTFTGATPRTDADIDGVACPAGQPRLLFLAAANRAPSTFPDPDRFDISRDPNPHLSFAAGAHFCLGAPLARLHGEVALSTLFTRLPGLAARTPPDITASVPIRQIDHFAVTWQRNRQTRPQSLAARVVPGARSQFRCRVRKLVGSRLRTAERDVLPRPTHGRLADGRAALRRGRPVARSSLLRTGPLIHLPWLIRAFQVAGSISPRVPARSYLACNPCTAVRVSEP